MLPNITSATLLGLSCVLTIFAAPFSFNNNPLGNGFPTVDSPSDSLTQINIQAHGSLPNGPPPPKAPSMNSMTSLKLIAFNELFEVAFFTQLLSNITNNTAGYEVGGPEGSRKFMVKALTAVQAQEELHVLDANNALVHFGGKAIEPCDYNFPVSNINDAVTLAQTFTDVVLGTLQNIVSGFGTDGDSPLIQGVASVVGQEGEQNGWYRTFLGKVPSALPFLTTSTREFAFSAIQQNFVVPGSCPDLGDIDLQTFDPLTVVTSPIDAKSQDLSFSVMMKDDDNDGNYKAKCSGMMVTYINQQNTPISVPISNMNMVDKMMTFSANFPYDPATFGNGLTIAAVTNGTSDFASAADVAKATMYGPGLIEIE